MVTIFMSSRDNHFKGGLTMFCFNNFDCSAVWQAICKYLGFGC